MPDIRMRLEQVQERIQSAAARSGRAADKITLIAVSKTHPVSVLLEAIEAGVTDLGENRVQEAEEKIGVIGSGARWHLIGHLQSNKARRAAAIFDCIETVDSIDIAARLERICREIDRPNLDVFVQVDLAGEVTKSGVEPEKAAALAEYISRQERLKLKGLMAIPPFFEDPQLVRPYFRRLRQMRDEFAEKRLFSGGATGELSMGMSHDFEVAIEEGATIVRVGTAIFGDRIHPADAQLT